MINAGAAPAPAPRTRWLAGWVLVLAVGACGSPSDEDMRARHYVKVTLQSDTPSTTPLSNTEVCAFGIDSTTSGRSAGRGSSRHEKAHPRLAPNTKVAIDGQVLTPVGATAFIEKLDWGSSGTYTEDKPPPDALVKARLNSTVNCMANEDCYSNSSIHVTERFARCGEPIWLRGFVTSAGFVLYDPSDEEAVATAAVLGTFTTAMVVFMGTGMLGTMLFGWFIVWIWSKTGRRKARGQQPGDAT